VIRLFELYGHFYLVVKVEILRWGTVPAHLGPLSVHVGPLLTVVLPQVIIEPQSIYSFTKTVRLFFF